MCNKIQLTTNLFFCVEVRTAINMNSTVENNNISEIRTKKGKGKKRENEIESE